MSEIKLVKLTNNTDLTLQVFQKQNAIQEVAGNGGVISPNLPVKKCTTAEQYQDYEDENNNPFFCIRDKADVHHNWTRIFHPTDQADTAALIHCHRNKWGDKFQIAQTVANDGRDPGLYLTASMRDDFPGEQRMLWIVGEIVQDVILPGGE